MPRKTKQEKVAEATAARLERTAANRRAGARKAAETRRQKAAEAAAPVQEPTPEASRGPQPHTAPPVEPLAGKARSEKTRQDPERVVIAYAGPLGVQTRELAERLGMSLADLAKDAVLVYQQQLLQLGPTFKPGAALKDWTDSQR